MSFARTTAALLMPFAVAIGSQAYAQDKPQKDADIPAPMSSQIVTGCSDGPFEWTLTESILRRDCAGANDIKVFEDCTQLAYYKQAIEHDIRKLEKGLRDPNFNNLGLSREHVQRGLNELKNIYRQVLPVWQRVTADPNNAYGCPGVS